MSKSDVHHSRSQLDAYEDFTNLRASDLKLRIEEMLRIKVNSFVMHCYLKFIKIKIILCFTFFRAQYHWNYVS